MIIAFGTFNIINFNFQQQIIYESFPLYFMVILRIAKKAKKNYFFIGSRETAYINERVTVLRMIR